MVRRLDPRIENWSGGRIRIYYRRQEMRKTGKKTADGQDLHEPELIREFSREEEAVPFRPGLALVQPSGYEPIPGVLVEIGVRGGELQAVAIRSEEDGPELTQSVLRKIGSPRQAIREVARDLVIRLELDDDGSVCGVPATNPVEARDFRSFEERTEDVQEAVEQAARKPGRPRLSDETLRTVAEIVREARAQREPADIAVMNHFRLKTLDAAKKRMRLARERGFLERRGDG
jgi:hypothetical protein